MTIGKLEGLGGAYTTVGQFGEGFNCQGDDIVIVSYKPLTSTYKHFGYERRYEAKLQIVLCRENWPHRSVYQEVAKHIAELNTQELGEEEAGWAHSIIAKGSQDYIKEKILECLPEEENAVKAQIAAELEEANAKAMQRETDLQTANFLKGIGQHDKSDYSVSGWQKIVDTWKTKYPLAVVPV